MLFDNAATLSRPYKYNPGRSRRTKCGKLKVASIRSSVSLESQTVSIALLVVFGEDVKAQTITISPEDAVKFSEHLADSGKRALQALRRLKKGETR